MVSATTKLASLSEIYEICSRKNLESALRFGNSLLVQDVESYDPILNPVLNKEVSQVYDQDPRSVGIQKTC